MFASMGLTVVLISSALFAAHPDVRTVDLDGRAYTCRPVDARVACPVDGDLGFGVGLAADIADSYGCIGKLANSPAAVTKAAVWQCFIGNRLESYANRLSLLMVNRECENKVLASCHESTECMKDDFHTGERYPGLCGHLGEFLTKLKRSGLDAYFSKEDGVRKCQALF